MIHIEAAPDHVLAMRVDGKLTKEDIGTVVRAVDAKLAVHERIGLVADITGMAGITMDGLMEDVRAEFKYLGEWSRFPKLSLIAEEGFLKQTALLVDKLVPQVEMRAFKPGEIDQAVAFAATAS